MCLSAWGQDVIPPARQPNNTFVLNTFNGVVRAKANWDECYQGIGQNVPYDFVNYTNPSKPACAGTKRPKIDAGYVWGATAVGNVIYFGTAANPQCLTQAGLAPDSDGLTPFETAAYVCEFGSSPYSPTPFPAQIGDLRPPRFYKYDTVSRVVTDITPKAPPGVCLSSNILCIDPFVQGMRGVRAVTVVPNTNNDIVMFAGPGFANQAQIAGGKTLFFYAYRISTASWIARYVAATGTAPPLTSLWDEIRRFVNVNGILYTGVGLPNDGNGGPYGGAVLKYIGNFNVIPPPPAPSSGSAIPVCSACFAFETVGYVDGEAAYINSHDNRLVVNTWPKPGLAAMWMSPQIPTGGSLSSADATNWKKIFSAADYEPDPVIRKAYAFGALLSFGGYLYFGSQNVPWGSTGVIAQTYGNPTTQEQSRQLIINSYRSVFVGRVSNLNGTPKFEILYGEAKLPVFTPTSNYGTWTPTPTGFTPLYGSSGFGNLYNNYIWQMAIFNNKLYVGTMDWSYLASLGASIIQGAPKITDIFTGYNFGGDIYSFANSSSAAIAEDITGFGNYTNYGVRNFIPVNGKLFVGTANPMNLLSNYTDSVPDGGWELLELTPKGGGTTR